MKIATPILLHSFILSFLLLGFFLSLASAESKNLYSFRTLQVIGDGLAGFSGLNVSSQFGYGTGYIGDVDGDGIVDLAVGAVGENSPTIERSGAVYILFLTEDSSVKKFTRIYDGVAGFSDQLHADDEFGAALMSPGDINNDGVPDLVVGATGDDTDGTRTGAVYLFFLTAQGGIKSFRKITSSQAGITSRNSDFGSAIAAMGDINADRVPDMIVGAYGAPIDKKTNVGIISVIFFNADGSIKSAVVNGPPEQFDQQLFGYSITNIGDLNGDGVHDIAVGAPGVTGSVDHGGGVYILFMNKQGGIDSWKLIATDSDGFKGAITSWGYFGSAVAPLFPNVHSGHLNLAIGAKYEHEDTDSWGSVWILELDQTGFVQELADDQIKLDHFGSSLAFLGEDEGEAKLVIGAPWGGPKGGDVYVVKLSELTSHGGPPGNAGAIAAAVIVPICCCFVLIGGIVGYYYFVRVKQVGSFAEFAEYQKL